MGEGAIALTEANIFGVMSLIFWALIFVISIKYLMFVMNADNNGEGGVMALVALAFPKPATRSKLGIAVLTLGLFGTALLFGDGVITPAISVLSAVEGLTVAAPAFEPLVIPLTIIILVLVFLPQRYGTLKVGRAFGPIILAWFSVISILGIYSLAQELRILKSINPYYAFQFFIQNGWKGFLILGTVFLVVTGGEALYADMGHFGKRPIRLGWFSVVFPALILNYLGQCALLLKDPSAIDNPFFKLAPEGMLYPTIAIATLATIIASQALISGTFSLTHQAVQLGYFPRVQIIHTNEDEKGQIYVPSVNWFLLFSTVFLVLFFETSNNLAAAYGIAITCTMVITTVLVSMVARKKWGWGLPATVGFTSLFLFIDVGFFLANVHKIPHGGWFPLVMAAIILIIMLTWNSGRRLLLLRLKEKIVPLDQFINRLKTEPIQRASGAAIFMTSISEGIPPSLIHNIKHNKILHETTILMNVSVEDIPHVSWSNRFIIKNQGHGIFSVYVKYGFMDTANIPVVLMRCQGNGLKFNLSEATYFLGRETLMVSKKPSMPRWKTMLFATLSKNAQRATDFFKLPTEQVFEIGTQVEI
jgi:KUP system potassium uptake protein